MRRFTRRRTRALAAGAAIAVAVPLAALSNATASADTPNGPASDPRPAPVASEVPAPTPLPSTALTPARGSAPAPIIESAGTPHTGTEYRGPSTTRAVTFLLHEGASPAAVVAWANGHGLTVISKSTHAIVVAGSVGTLTHLLRTAVTTTEVPAPDDDRSRTGIVPERPLQVPAELASTVSAVSGLDDRPVMRPLGSPSGSTSGGEVLRYYDQAGPSAGAGAARGAGLTVATLQFSGWDYLNSTAFAAVNGITLPKNWMSIWHSSDLHDDDVIDRGDGPGAQEVVLDVDAILATAPRAKQRIYMAGSTVSGLTEALNKMIQDSAQNQFQVLSISWGQCELNWGNDPAASKAFLASLQPALAQIAANGVTIFAATGDTQVYGCSYHDDATDSDVLQTDVSPMWPATDPSVVAVGGTTLNRAGATVNETAWGRGGFGMFGSGGGTSSVFDRPAYQPATGVADQMRTIPDVSALADPDQGLLFPFAASDEGWLQMGGTSLASPLWAGMLASALSAAGRTTGIGDIHNKLYAAPKSAFIDVLTGGGWQNRAKAGYDLSTGLGSPRWSTLAPALGLTPTKTALYGWFHPLPPSRVLDTRHGVGVPAAKVGAGRTIKLKVTGRGGVPSSGVSAVVLNTTVTDVTAATYVSVYPTGAAGGSRSSNLNIGRGDTRANLVVSRVASDGTVTLYNAQGSVSLIADVAGYYSVGAGAPVSNATYPANAIGDAYVPLLPARVLDTRIGTGVRRGKVSAGKTVTLRVTGRAGIPDDGSVTAVALNTTVTNVTAATYVSVYPTGYSAGPRSSNLNVGAGDTRPNAVIVPVSASGTITLYNAVGSVDLIADVEGYYAPDSAATAYQPLSPARVLDTRSGTGVARGKVAAGRTVTLRVAGRAGVPASGVEAVVLNTTATNVTAPTYVSVYPAGYSNGPRTSSLNIGARDTRPNLVIVPVSSSGSITLYNDAGSVDLIADIQGYYS